MRREEKKTTPIFGSGGYGRPIEDAPKGGFIGRRGWITPFGRGVEGNYEYVRMYDVWYNCTGAV